MFKTLSATLLTLAVVCMIGCEAHKHTVGHGTVFNRTNVERQWYLLYGYVPVNPIDTQAMAEGRSNYEITTQITWIDALYRSVLAPATITCRTVSVTR